MQQVGTNRQKEQGTVSAPSSPSAPQQSQLHLLLLDIFIFPVLEACLELIHYIESMMMI